jgi:hypothetical protein
VEKAMGTFPIPDLSGLVEELADNERTPIPPPVLAFLEQLLAAAYPNLDETYRNNAVLAALLSSYVKGKMPILPMLDVPDQIKANEMGLSKTNALPYIFWGLAYDNWSPSQGDDPKSVFVTGYEDRNVGNSGGRRVA